MTASQLANIVEGLQRRETEYKQALNATPTTFLLRQLRRVQRELRSAKSAMVAANRT